MSKSCTNRLTRKSVKIKIPEKYRDLKIEGKLVTDYTREELRRVVKKYALPR